MARKRILVVDDDDAWLQTMELILAGKYDLALTKEPSEAVSLVKSSFFSLAILDQRISGDLAGGVHLLERLREVQPDLRGIILTGYAELEDAVESMKIGAYDYISKGRPNLAGELQIRIEKALEHSPIAALVERGESAELEFKSSARWDIRLNKVNHELAVVVVKTVAAFLNSEIGGTLLIGVDDNGKAVGLESDYKTLKKQDRDGFERFLVELLLDAYGKDLNPFIRIDFHHLAGNDVCRISARPAPRAVYVREELYVRTGNSIRQLSAQDAVGYCKTRWK
jgi:ActR/RegA family two-component response regulator